MDGVQVGQNDRSLGNSVASELCRKKGDRMINYIVIFLLLLPSLCGEQFLMTCRLGGHVRNAERNHDSQPLHFHDGGFSERQTSLIGQGREPTSAHNFIDLCLDFICKQNSSHRDEGNLHLFKTNKKYQ